ncbi:hypothetical protein CQ019_06175 [Arthrobacter sp. MYb229]|uniref:CDP-glycerol glycerophosphotransferase family protein n=1 Tax=unclassified Arthrobacter TaxID=235627 RepID=UPI000CFCA484|nr:MULTISPECIES: CDP-glycerol glycerophosphotransferase family protein [unclassified Arthrobacter]PRA06933.1 hypothetical protein CQ019_06175 [Arthrobacter sp. MYb229]PRB47881.1 hypothetical protein CQ013_15970 [Arthrobacter sp. MYb216]
MSFLSDASKRIRARLAEKSGEWDRAIDLYRNLVSENGNEFPEDLYRLGHAAIQIKSFDIAAEAFQQLVQVDPSAHYWYRYGFTQQKLGNWSEAVGAYHEAIEINGSNADWHYRIAVCEEKLGNSSEAISAVRQAISIAPEVEAHHNKLIALVRKTNQLWMLAEVLEHAIRQFPTNAVWRKQLSQVLVSLERHEDVVNALANLEPETAPNAKNSFYHGRALEQLARHKEAQLQYAIAIANDKVLNSSELGIGVFFQAEGDYTSALKWYGRAINRNAAVPELHYRMGLCYERIYEWEKARASYEVAVLVDPKRAGWHYRLGLVCERLEIFDSAAAAYRRALEKLGKSNKYWAYRLGLSLHKSGKDYEACEAFGLHREVMPAPSESDTNNALGDSQSSETAPGSRIIDLQTINADEQKETLRRVFGIQSAELSFDAGVSLAEEGLFALATEAFKDAVLRADDHTAKYYVHLAQSFLSLDLPFEAAEAFIGSRIIGRPFGIDETPYLKSLDSKRNVHYAEFCDTLLLEEEWILYESNAGQAVGCNPLALFRELTAHETYSRFMHFWAVADDEAIPDEIRGNPNVIILKRNSTGYMRVLASAKYLINNNTFAPYFSRRVGQKYLNTWHGIPMKTLGRDIKTGTLDHKNAARNLLHATHIIAPNQHTLDILIERNDVQGIFSGKAALTGYPRVDTIVESRADRQAELRIELGVLAGEEVILYAPTWRGDLQSQLVDVEQIKSDLEALAETGRRVFFKGHTMVEKQLSFSTTILNLVPKHVDTNDMLSITDVLITDYSSILFDFLPTGRKSILYVFDEPEYRSTRGLYFELSEFPSHVCHSIDEVRNCLALDIPVQSEKAKWAHEEFWALEDGSSTRRAIEFFFEDNAKHEVELNSSRKQILVYQGSFIPNGITSAFSNLISSLDLSDPEITVVIDPGAVYGDPKRAEIFEKSRDRFKTLARVGRHLGNIEEMYVLSRFSKHGFVGNERFRDIYFAAFSREYRRIFGEASFDSTLCFEGFSVFWASLLAAGRKQDLQRQIMLHSDMLMEQKTRFNGLTRLFSLYGSFDRLISVSESAHEVNQNNLSADFSVPEEKFTYANNLINNDEILAKSQEPLDDEVAAWMQSGSSCFVTVGRLSPEKGHRKLIDALDTARRLTGLDLRLLIVGGGTLLHQLTDHVRALGLEDSVRLLGYSSNPYPYMRHADCFTFSSDYEGQGIVVLEALVLNLPVISVDVVGPRSVLQGGLGQLVANDVESIARALAEFGKSPFSACDFDGIEYNDKAKHQMVGLLTGSH